MCDSQNLREYLRNKYEELERDIDVDAILNVSCFAEIFDDKELQAIRQEADVTKRKIFLQKLHVRGDDESLYKFIDALRLVQPNILLLRELDDTLLMQASCGREPVEDEDDTWPQDPDETTVKVVKYDKNDKIDKNACAKYENVEDCHEDDSVARTVIKQIVEGLNEISDLQEADRNYIQNRFNALVNECNQAKEKRDSYKYWYRRLAECMSEMCYEGHLSYQRVISSLESLGHHDMAQQFSTLKDCHVKEMHYVELRATIKQKLTKILSGEGDVWPLLPEWLNINDIHINYLKHQSSNPASDILDKWARRRSATVDALYTVLMDNGLEMAATVIEANRFTNI